MASKYNIKNTVRKYTEGGSSAYAYGANDSYLDYTNKVVQNNRNDAQERYNASMSDANNQYNTFLQTSYQNYMTSQNTYNSIKGGLNTALGTKMPGQDMTQRQNLNNNITNAFNQDTGNPNKGLSIHDPNYQEIPGNTLSYNQWYETESLKNRQTGTTLDRENFTDTPRRDYRDYKQEMKAGRNLTSPQYIAKERGTQVGEGFSSIDGGTYEMTNKGLIQTHKDMGVEVGTDVGTDVATKTAAKPPIKGGLWTTAADMGLHYLSNDNDPGTYTSGEVATDVGSLALDVFTYDWIGAVMQVGDMVMQGTEAKKIQKSNAEASRIFGNKVFDAKNTFAQDFRESSEVATDRRYAKGSSSQTGYGRLGGFKYNI